MHKLLESSLSKFTFHIDFALVNSWKVFQNIDTFSTQAVIHIKVSGHSN